MNATNRNWTKEETELLIAKLAQLPELWDISLEHHKNRPRRFAALEHLANDFSTEPREITRKLHNLRTQFNNELRKIRKRSVGQEEDKSNLKSAWQFFDSLLFLRQNQTGVESHNNFSGMYDDDNVTQSCDVVLESPKPPLKQMKTHHCDESIPESINPANHTVVSSCEDDQIFGNFVAASLRNMQFPQLKRKLKRKIQAVILEIEELDDAMASNSMCYE